MIDVQYQAPTGSLDAFVLAANTGDNLTDTSQSERSEITRQENTYDDNGLLIRVMYQRDNLREPACDGSGVYGMSMAYNRMGQLLLVKADGTEICVMQWEYRYDGRNNCVEKTLHRDSDGDREEKTVVFRYSYNEYGDLIEESYFMGNGNKANNGTYHRVVYEYDDLGNLLAEIYYDADGNEVSRDTYTP